MGIRTDKALRQPLIFFSIVLMLVALFTSRVLLSVGTISFLLLTCLHTDIIKQFSTFLKAPLLIGMSLLFFLPAVSGLWSEDQVQWLRWVRIKLPLFLLPLAFAGNWQLSKRQWTIISYAFIILVFLGCCWSLGQYLSRYQDINESYLRAKSIPTLLENDHIRFSLLVCIAIITAVFLLRKTGSRIGRFCLSALSIFLAIYLHVLFARTGLIAFYLFLFSGLFYLILSRHKKMAVVLIFACCLMPLVAFLLLPTFQNRVRYMIYDFSHIRANKYLPGSNDGTRLISLKAGWHVLKENPLGVGAGDVVNESFTWYEVNMPQMPEKDKIYPASEWLLYGGVAGWPGVVLFSGIMFLPLFVYSKDRFFWINITLVSASSLLFDVGLETQFGVFIYAFVVLWWWKWLKTKPLSPAKDPSQYEAKAVHS
jgi:O-antigen ligase